MKHTKIKSILAITAALSVFAATPKSAVAGPDPFVGEISYVGFSYAPQNWAKCDGQSLPISQNSALFSLLGTTYGGNGTTTFNLPDMRGRVPVHQGQAPGRPAYPMGAKGGYETATLTINEMPSHTHVATATSSSTSTVSSGATATSTLKAVNSDADQKNAAANSLANAKGAGVTYSSSAPNVDMNPASIVTTLNGLAIETTTNTNVVVANAGGSLPFSILQPYLVVNCIIALNGNYPPRQ